MKLSEEIRRLQRRIGDEDRFGNSADVFLLAGYVAVLAEQVESQGAAMLARCG